MGTRFEWFSRSGYDRATGKWDKPVPEGAVEVQDDGSLYVLPDDDHYGGEMSSEYVQVLVQEIFAKLPRTVAGELMFKIAACILDKEVTALKQVAPEMVGDAENVDDLLVPAEALCQKAASRVLAGGNLIDVDRTGVSDERVIRHVFGLLLETLSVGITMGRRVTDMVALVLAPKLMRRARVLTEGAKYFKDPQ